MADIEDWDVAAANNTSAPPDGAPESTTTIGDVNDIFREIMAVVARWYQDTDGAQATTGSSNAYTFASNRSVSAHYDGQVIAFDANHTNTGAATLRADGATDDAIKKYSGDDLIDVIAADIVSGGKYIVIFDGTQWILVNPSNGVMRETTWTPALTFATPGDLSVAYSTQVGSYKKVGKLVIASFDIVTSTFTFTTASGALQVSGLPFAAVGTTGLNHTGAVWHQGFNNTSFSSVVCNVGPSASVITFIQSDATNGTNAASVLATDCATGTNVTLHGTLIYFAAT